MLLTVLAADAIWESSKEILKVKGAGLLEKIGDKLLSRTEEGSLPPNHNLYHALCHSLGKTTRVLAYTIHNPDLSPLSKLIANFKVGELADRLSEMVQNNIVEKTSTDYWLSALIDESKKVESFKDFSLELLLNENQLTSLVHERLDKCLQDHVQNEFLAWSNRHVLDRIKPSCFDDYVLNGWSLSGGGGRKITFYEVFCLFFREELKNDDKVFRAFTVNTLAHPCCEAAHWLMLKVKFVKSVRCPRWNFQFFAPVLNPADSPTEFPRNLSVGIFAQPTIFRWCPKRAARGIVQFQLPATNGN
jgi:hypothetical protein